ncbi:MAG: cupin domain-containing protein [Actinomycetia bacterium]|nr:cupin domain-containing protein [Actinomycetes bacterium]MCP4959646.1 cupin domain-containing protein [Actinomycetes bacterium]
MPQHISAPFIVGGVEPKLIEEYVGGVSTSSSHVSVARMVAPGGWEEPGQRPGFEEITVVLKGVLRVEHEDGVLDVSAGEAIVTQVGEWVRYSTPGAVGAEYMAVCLPAFTPDSANRDE